VFIAVALAIAVLAVVARLAVSGLGPFPATVDAVEAQEDGLAVTLTVTNQGESSGRTTCRISRASDRAVTTSAFVTSPQLGPHETRTFTTVVTQFGPKPDQLDVACRAP
jgi:predicted secreted protein